MPINYYDPGSGMPGYIPNPNTGVFSTGIAPILHTMAGNRDSVPRWFRDPRRIDQYFHDMALGGFDQRFRASERYFERVKADFENALNAAINVSGHKHGLTRAQLREYRSQISDNAALLAGITLSAPGQMLAPQITDAFASMGVDLGKDFSSIFLPGSTLTHLSPVFRDFYVPDQSFTPQLIDNLSYLSGALPDGGYDQNLSHGLTTKDRLDILNEMSRRGTYSSSAEFMRARVQVNTLQNMSPAEVERFISGIENIYPDIRFGELSGTEMSNHELMAAQYAIQAHQRTEHVAPALRAIRSQFGEDLSIDQQFSILDTVAGGSPFTVSSRQLVRDIGRLESTAASTGFSQQQLLMGMFESGNAARERGQDVRTAQSMMLTSMVHATAMSGEFNRLAAAGQASFQGTGIDINTLRDVTMRRAVSAQGSDFAQSLGFLEGIHNEIDSERDLAIMQAFDGFLLEPGDVINRSTTEALKVAIDRGDFAEMHRIMDMVGVDRQHQNRIGATLFRQRSALSTDETLDPELRQAWYAFMEGNATTEQLHLLNSDESVRKLGSAIAGLDAATIQRGIDAGIYGASELSTEAAMNLQPGELISRNRNRIAGVLRDELKDQIDNDSLQRVFALAGSGASIEEIGRQTGIMLDNNERISLRAMFNTDFSDTQRNAILSSLAEEQTQSAVIAERSKARLSALLLPTVNDSSLIESIREATAGDKGIAGLFSGNKIDILNNMIASGSDFFDGLDRLESLDDKMKMVDVFASLLSSGEDVETNPLSFSNTRQVLIERLAEYGDDDAGILTDINFAKAAETILDMRDETVETRGWVFRSSHTRQEAIEQADIQKQRAGPELTEFDKSVETVHRRMTTEEPLTFSEYIKSWWTEPWFGGGEGSSSSTGSGVADSDEITTAISRALDGRIFVVDMENNRMQLIDGGR